MKKAQNASLAFKKEIASNKGVFGDSVIENLTTNAGMFPNLPVTLADLQDAIDTLKAAATKAKGGSHVAVEELDTAIETWNSYFALTAKYVSVVANGSAEVIRNSGFIPTKADTTPAQLPGVPLSYVATINGKPGAVEAGTKKGIKSKTGYLFFVAPTDVTISFENNVMLINIGDKTVYISAETRKAASFYNLESGKPYNVGMYAFNAAGSGPAAVKQVIPQ